MKKIVTIVGARPQFIKAAAISRAIRTHFADQIQEYIVHTGQHYDPAMSEVFFSEMDIPREDANLQVGSGNHGAQTAKMLGGIEEIIISTQADAVLVYGDTNSTLAGALAAAKLHVPLIHIEAGLRSFNKKMPEEINRITSDHCSTLLFTPTPAGIKSLKNEGFDVDAKAPYDMNNPGVFLCGDVMYDNSLFFREKASSINSIQGIGLEESFALVTIHRPQNTDIPANLDCILRALMQVADDRNMRMIIPLHPRTLNLMRQGHDALNADIEAHPLMSIIKPVSYLEMIALESGSNMVFTDSGGVQKEAYFFQKPCVIMRPETEWVELVENGNAILVGADGDKILAATKTLMGKSDFTYPDFYGDGFSAEFICKTIVENLV